MTKINFGRVILGGLVAGILLNLGDFLLHEPIMGEQWKAAMTAYNMPTPGTGAITYFVIMDFIIAIAMVWLYAAMRPRFGAGVRTAIVAGLVVWFFGWLTNLGGLMAMNIYPTNLLTTTLIWGFVQMPVVAILGAWLYKEA
ncbi:MAG TPA: hypothetical protein VHP63_03955 [candidate division Zixibacteria bacterium]|nr:hypothetical protein [candidate division Zixibacteria bacterium]